LPATQALSSVSLYIGKGSWSRIMSPNSVTLTEGQLSVLRNLAEKRDTHHLTAFINISDAQELTQLGFAERTRQGWDITASGAAYLASRRDAR
jgi:hypothetical protein